MRADDDLRDDEEQARAEHFTSRRAHYYDEQRERDLDAQSATETEEAEEARWLRAFARQAIEEAPVRWSERPGIDRRAFSVDGELDLHRPDPQDVNIPWPAA